MIWDALYVFENLAFGIRVFMSPDLIKGFQLRRETFLILKFLELFYIKTKP